jgi:membrane protein DedA with SNARE-associated domain
MEALAGSIMSLAGGNPGLSAFFFLLTFGYWTPIPEELALVAIGFALKSAHLPYPAALAVSLAALALSDSVCYCFARFLGPLLLRLKPMERLLRSDRVLAAERSFARKGPIFIFASRFVVGFRSAAALGSGFMRLPYLRFLVPSLSALVIGGPLWLGIGFFAGAKFGSMFETAGKLLSALGILAAIVLSVAVAGRIAGRRLRAGAEEA